jgi:peptidoglycan hydrolase FlgJ
LQIAKTIFNSADNSYVDDSGLSIIGYRGALDSKCSTGLSSIGKTDRAEPSEADKKKALNTAQDFEAIFLRILLGSMRNASMKSGLFGDNLASNVYEDMFFSETADLMAHSKPGIGLADIIYQDIIRLGNYETSAPDDDANAAMTSLEYSSQLNILSSETAR